MVIKSADLIMIVDNSVNTDGEKKNTKWDKINRCNFSDNTHGYEENG